MTNRIQTCLLALALLASASCGFAADSNIGFVDMRKVFDEYYKTIQANNILTNDEAEMKKTIDSMAADAEKTRKAAMEANDRANDQTISADERAKSRKIAQDKADEYRSIQSGIEDYRERENSRLADKMHQSHDAIVGQILADEKRLAKKAGYTLVLDKSGESNPGVPMVLYTEGENDLTDALIKDLNATAPAIPASETPASTSPTNSTNSVSKPPGIPPPDTRLLPTPGNN
ncbi:MAG: OmpH family outer membrane protein [Verrucomicrobiota bacterium]|jgi:Skp family chaperone for outer membrane proteins